MPNYLQVICNVANSLSLSLHVVQWGGEERDGAILRGAISKLSNKQWYEQVGLKHSEVQIIIKKKQKKKPPEQTQAKTPHNKNQIVLMHPVDKQRKC